MIQQENCCCGVYGANDYGLPPEQMPSSCCGRYIESRLTNIGDCSADELKNAKGCGLIRFLEIFKDDLNISFHRYTIIAGIVFGIQAIFVGLSFLLGKRMAEQKKHLKELGEQISMKSQF